MKRLTHYIDGITIVFSSMAILFVFMLGSAYVVIDDISGGSSAQIVKEEKKQTKGK